MFLSLSPSWDYRKEGATTSLADFSKFCNDQFHLRLTDQELFNYQVIKNYMEAVGLPG